MLSLARSEFARFRWHALALAALLFGLLLFLDQAVDVVQQPIDSYRLGGAVAFLIGLALGLYQFGTHARPSAWVSLLHRPLAPWRIGLGLQLGAAAALALALAAPVALLLAAHGAFGGLVDLRHLLLPMAALLFGLVGHGAGAIAILAPRRYAWLALIPALFPAFAKATGPAALLIQAATVAVLGLAVLALLRPARSAPPGGARGGLLTALTAAGAFFVITQLGDMAFQTGWIITGSHPLNSTPSRGGIIEAQRAQGPALFDRGLAASRHPQADLWREQARLSEVFTVEPALERLPTRGELTNLAPMRFDDPEHRVRYTFSHDSMRFHGRSLDRGTPAGRLGVGDDHRPFPAPPLAAGEGVLMSAESVDQFDSFDQRIHRRIRLPAGETVASPPRPAGESVALLSDRALRLYDARVLEEGDEAYPAHATVPLPAPVGSLMRIDLMEQMDGHLLSFTYGRDSVNGPGQGWQSIVRLDSRGRATPVARRALATDFPLVSRYASLWVSPGIARIQSAALALFAGRSPLIDKAPDRVPPTVWLLAAMTLIASAAATALVARRRRLKRGAAIGWTLAALVLGPPLAIAFWLVAPRGRV